MWKLGSYSKAAAAALAVAQLGLWPAAGLAAPSPSAPAASAPAPNAEEQLLSTAITASGMNVSREQLTETLAQAVHNYEQSASAGSEDRLVSAMIQMNILSPEQAQSFRDSVDASVRNALAINPQAAEEAVVGQTLQAVLSQEQGAQFSACDMNADAEIAGFGLGILGGLTTLAGTVVDAAALDCTGTFRVVCVPDPSGQASASKIEIDGGIAAGIGIVVIAATMALEGNSCDGAQSD